MIENPGDFLMVAGLAGTAWEMSALTHESPSLFGLGGAMGAAPMMALGLALAQPKRRVLVATGDGELLMNVGALATIALQNPPNLTIICVDNGHYGETGNQEPEWGGAAVASGQLGRLIRHETVAADLQLDTPSRG